MAGLFGGGGHKLAAGAALSCGMQEAKARVVAAVADALRAPAAV
ncbi:MAG: hypothetical protein ACYCW6_01925 [Candidatus Xenobia bacterium]